MNKESALRIRRPPRLLGCDKLREVASHVQDETDKLAVTPAIAPDTEH